MPLSFQSTCFDVFIIRYQGNIFIVIVKLGGLLNKFPDFFRVGTFIDITHMKLYSPSK